MPKEAGGSCMPNNGIALSKAISLSFVKGEFTLSPHFEILVHPKCKNEIIQDYNLKQIRVPPNAFFQPSQESIRYHRENIYKTYTG